MKLRGKFARRRPTRHARPEILTLEDRRLLAYTVINALDDGSAGTLRWAVEQANNNPGPDTIEFDSGFFSSPRSIDLSGSHLDLTDTSGQTTINGPAGGVTINAGGLSRVLVVEPMVSASLSGLTITGANNPYGYGGGLYSLGDTTLTNCTISGNSAMLGSGASTGAYFSPTGSISLINCTIGGNSGYQLISFGSPVHAVNTVVAGDYYASLDPTSTNNLIGGGAMLAPLGDYGGTSLTMPLLPGSPGIDGGTSTGAPTTDQRGEPRFGGVDIGAFESQGFQFTLVPSSGPQSADIGTAFSYPLAVSVTANNPIEPVDGGGGVIFTPIAAGNGATAMLDNTAPVITGGVAAVTAVPNNVLGSYVVEVSFPGSSASVSLENTGSVFTSFVVNTTSDSLTPGVGLLSLREAIAFNHHSPSGIQPISFDANLFSTPQTITLSGSPLEMSNPDGTFTINGPAGGVTIDGGGLSRVFVVEPMVSASLSGLTITGGSNSYGYGGGLYSLGETTLTNCTISGNSASFGSGAATGGSGSISLINCTIGGNTGYQLVSIAAPVHAVNTVVAGDYYASLDPTSTNNLIGGGAMLAPLGDYGGTSLTMPLLPGSPGIDGGTSTGAPTTDQRGEPRFGGVDIGAFESQGFQFTLVPSSSPQSADIGTAFPYPLAVSITANNPIEPVDGGGGVVFTPIAAGNGATAMLDTLAPVITGGIAAVTAVPNNALGSYVVEISFPGSSASVSLENTGSVFTSFVVNTTSDSLTPGAGLLSLREAITFNNHSTTGLLPISFDANVFSTSQTITLSGSPLELSNPDGTFSINGPAGGVTIDGAGLSRVFVVDPTVTAEISDLTITGGRATSAPGGGGILNQGSLTLRNVRVHGNVAGVNGPYFASWDMNGGGIANLGTLVVEGSVIDGNSAFSGGGIFSTGQLEIVNSSIRGNSASFDGGGLRSDGLLSMTGGEVSDNVVNGYIQGIGGGISNRGEASLVDCTISGNSASAMNLGYGGGIANFGSLTLTNSAISGNSAVLSSGYGDSYGGGLMNGGITDHPGTATLVDCVISGNSAGLGGGVHNSGSSLDMTGCTLIGNTASNSGGGLVSAGTVSVYFTYQGMLVTSYNAVATLVDCEISGNDAGVDGGGLVTKGRDSYGYTATGTLNLTNCTVSGNSAGGAGGGLVVDALGIGTLSNATIGGNTSGGDGGGIANNNGTLNVTQATITDNNSQGSGGGIHQGGTGATALTNSLVSGNHAGAGASRVADNLGGASSGFSGEGNLIGSGAVSLDPATNLVGIDNALLAPLGNYGGPTQTYALLPGSPAIDAAIDAYATEHDQRGWGRVGRADIGAFESQGFTLTPVAGSTPQTTMIGAAFNRPIAVTVKANNAVEPVDGGVVTFQAPTSGASAVLSAATGVIAGGTASVDAIANGELGGYAVSAATAGAATAASFALTNTQAMVGDISVGWGSQTADLFTDADGVRLLPAGRENTIGWTNIRSFTVHLLGAGSLSANDVSVLGENGTNYGPVTVTSLGGGTYRITLARPILSAGRTTLTISNAAVGTYTRRLDILPGDINDDGRVNATDLNALKLYLVGRTSSPAISGIPSIYFDLDGNGAVNLFDYMITVLAIGRRKTRLT